MHIQPGFRPGHHWKSLQSSHADPLAGFQGADSRQGRGGNGRGKEGEGKGKA